MVWDNFVKKIVLILLVALLLFSLTSEVKALSHQETEFFIDWTGTIEVTTRIFHEGNIDGEFFLQIPDAKEIGVVDSGGKLNYSYDGSVLRFDAIKSGGVVIIKYGTDAYTLKNEKGWQIHFQMKNVPYISNNNYKIHFPQGSALSNLGYDWVITEEEHGLIAFISSPNQTEKNITINYLKQEEPFNTSLILNMGNIIPLFFILLIIYYIFILWFIFFKARKKKEDSIEYQKFEGVLLSLSDTQREIVLCLRKKNDPITQNKLMCELGLPKSTLSRNLHALSNRQIIDIKDIGNMNRINLNKDTFK